ncbi:hypothetical protein AC629_36340 [Bradyrhizobium sp. NAS80.1]|uniref:hypothetical protein n=1 Tax=Bradyrhizobium sp. NAS80.1 TaxID=1680159 RepID=UPI000965F500|nr:hypothetical protein [Bradyrhizobium sp. NAS80.1]OKO73816.1 hypothetical protein AC629_36340 [Bradyrhizobium sp. NAS80.1]
MLRDEQLSILRDISQSVAFADDRQGKMGQLIADGYVMKDGDLFELTAKGVSAVEEHAAALCETPGESDATSTPSYRLV